MSGETSDPMVVAQILLPISVRALSVIGKALAQDYQDTLVMFQRGQYLVFAQQDSEEPERDGE